jgi:hypothetical protein
MDGLYCSTILTIAIELAQTRPAYEDIASKFFEHFISIIDAINTVGGSGLWDDDEGFYFDQLVADGEEPKALCVRSIVSVLPLSAVGILHGDEIDRLPGFQKRMNWFLKNKPQLAQYVSEATTQDPDYKGSRFIALVPKDRLLRILSRGLDET